MRVSKNVALGSGIVATALHLCVLAFIMMVVGMSVVEIPDLNTSLPGKCIVFIGILCMPFSLIASMAGVWIYFSRKEFGRSLLFCFSALPIYIVSILIVLFLGFIVLFFETIMKTLH